MKTVVTGGAGYIGSVLVARLIEDGHTVIVLDNLTSGHRKQVHPKAIFIEGDIENFETYFENEKGIDVVIHLAALIQVGESMSNPAIYWNNNVLKTHKMLEGLRKLNIKKIIFASTAAVYGNPEIVPVDEHHPKRPTNTYGMTKLATEMKLESYVWAYDFASISFRFFNVAGAYREYGELHKRETHIIPLLLQSAVHSKPFTIFGNTYETKDGTNERDYIHVMDLARAISLSLDKLEFGKYKVYNLGAGETVSNLELAHVVEDITGKKITLQFDNKRIGDPAILHASNKKAKEGLGWEPKHSSIENIIKTAYEFFLKHHDKK